MNEILKLYNEYINKVKVFHFKSFIKKYNLNITEEYLYQLIHDIKNIPTCHTCDKELKFKNLIKGYGVFCDIKCSNSNKNKINKAKEWFRDKNKLKIAKDKTKITCLKKYGTECITQSEYFKKLTKNTIKEKYGVNNPAQKHIKHFNDLYEDFVRNNFIKNGCFLYKEFIDYFHIGYDGAKVWRKKLNISERNKRDNNISKNESIWLDILNIPNDNIHRQVRIDKYIVDGYDPQTKTVYEFLGDYWHGNLNIFNYQDINPLCKKTYLELFEQTNEKFEKLKELGYNIIWIWESEFKNKLNDILWNNIYNNKSDLIKYKDK